MRIFPKVVTPLRYDLAVYSGQTDFFADSPSSHVSVAYRGAGFPLKTCGNDGLSYGIVLHSKLWGIRHAEIDWQTAITLDTR